MWRFNDKELEDEDVPEKSIGFIYLITQTSTGKKYIGRKLLTSASSKMVNGKRKKIRITSNWKDYWSSSPWLNEYIEQNGTEDFSREILCFAYSKSALNYMEEKIQYSLGVLESDDWINSNIRSKMYRKWVCNFPNLNELNSVINHLQSQTR